MRRIILLLPLIMAFVLTTIPVLAAGTFRSDITVTDTSGADRTGVAALLPFGVEAAVDMGYLGSDGLDTRMLEGTSEMAYMVVDDRLGVFIPSLLSYQERLLGFETGYSPPNSSFSAIPGDSGYVTIPYSSTIELGDNFEVEFQWYIDTSAGSDKNLVFKDSAFKIWISPTTDGTMSVSVYDSGWTNCVATATNVSSGVHFIEVTGDVADLKLYINGALKDTDTLVSVPDNTDDWYLAQNNSVAYMEFFKIWTD